MTIKNNQIEDAPRKQTKSSAPAVGADQGSFYTKEISGVTEGFYIDSMSREIQITNNGQVKAPVLGEANTTSNAGAVGEGLALPKVGTDLPFKRLLAGTNITLTPAGSYVEIAAAFPPPAGESNTASNVGSSGVGIFKAKSGVDLQFKKIVAGSNIIIVDLGNEIQINAGTGGGGGGGEANTASNLGTITDGLGVYSAKVGVDLRFKRIKAGNGISLTDEANDILITATGGGGGGGGDMYKSTYDTNSDGIVDNASALAGQLPAYYLGRTNHTGTQSVSTITGLAAVATSGTLSSLTDCTIGTPSNGQVLSWSTSLSKWVPITFSAGAGDMLKSVYDTTNNGIVDNSEKLNNQLPSYYLDRTNHTGTFNLDDLSNVNCPSPSVNDVLKWNGTQWVNSASGGGGASTLNDLTDVTISGTPTNNQILRYNSTSSQWENQSVTIPTNIDSLTDVTISGTPTNNQFLRYNSGSSQWENQSVTIPSNIDSLTDVTISGTPTNNQFLRYNSTSSQWENQTVSVPTNLDSLSDVVISGTPTTGQVIKYDGTNWVNGSVSGGGGGTEVRLLSFDGGNIVIRASGDSSSLDSVTATKDFSTGSRSTLILNKPSSVVYHSIYVTFTATETTGRTEIALQCPDLNGATSTDQAVRPFAVRYNLTTGGIGATTSTFSLISGSTFLTLLTGYTAATAQKASFSM